MPALPPPVKQNSEVTLEVEGWDGWPDGEFERIFTWAEFQVTGKLRSHWSYETTGGDKTGDMNAEDYNDGYKTSRDCKGVLMCDNRRQCRIVVRAQTREDQIEKQLDKSCDCGSPLIRVYCGVTQTLRKFADGVHFRNSGTHDHVRPTHKLHLLPKEQTLFKQLVKSYPKSGPLALVYGVRTMDGPGESAAEISNVLGNTHRTGYERRKIKKELATSAGDSFMSALEEFDMKHPGFLKNPVYSMGQVSVVSFQSDFMREQLYWNGEENEEITIKDPVNGTVNDAAHGWWINRNWLLMVTSVFCPALQRWVPGLFSFMNGASAEHFKFHFLHLINSIADEALLRGFTVEDQLFVGVRCNLNEYILLTVLLILFIRSWISVKLSMLDLFRHLYNSGSCAVTINGLMKSFSMQQKGCFGVALSIFVGTLHESARLVLSSNLLKLTTLRDVVFPSSMRRAVKNLKSGLSFSWKNILLSYHGSSGGSILHAHQCFSNQNEKWSLLFGIQFHLQPIQKKRCTMFFTQLLAVIIISLRDLLRCSR